jgi:hypothetical protein
MAVTNKADGDRDDKEKKNNVKVEQENTNQKNTG